MHYFVVFFKRLETMGLSQVAVMVNASSVYLEFVSDLVITVHFMLAAV